MCGWDVEVVAWSRFFRWKLIKICVGTCDMNSTLGSVVPLAMFYFSVFRKHFGSKCQIEKQSPLSENVCLFDNSTPFYWFFLARRQFWTDPGSCSKFSRLLASSPNLSSHPIITTSYLPRRENTFLSATSHRQLLNNKFLSLSTPTLIWHLICSSSSKRRTISNFMIISTINSFIIIIIVSTV